MARKSRRRTAPEPNSNDLPPRPKPRRRYVLASLLVLIIFVAGGGGWIFADWWFCLPDEVEATYVGRSSCVECHATEVQEWIGSDHDLAMDVANDKTVLADFNDVEFTHHGVVSRMYRDGPKFMVHTEGPDGKITDFEVKYVLGIRPLQQYMVEFDRPEGMPESEIARVQVLRLTWDTEKNEWFYLPPPDVPEKLAPSDVLHWTGMAQCWNTMCAYCHSTNLQKSFDVETATYHTTFSEIDVSCEACHGPASIHVELANNKSLFWDRKRGYGLAKLKTADTRPQIHTCAPCHARRSVNAPDFQPGDNFYDYFNNELLAEQTYFADGQILDEDYVFGSFIQSKMYHQDIRCTDCHNPHTARLKYDGNKVCTSCHQHAAAKYDTPAHHFHKTDSTGASCVECHMPEATYMEVDPRRDHSIRIPRPDLSVAIGTPNACTRCHISDAEISDEKRSTLKQYNDWIRVARAGDEELQAELERLDKWMLESVQEWYEKESWGDSFAFALEAARRQEKGAEQKLAEVAGDRKLPGVVRATALFQRGLLLNPVVSLEPERAALQDEDPQVRVAAANRIQMQIPTVRDIGLADYQVENLPERQMQELAGRYGPMVRPLVPLLDDPRRTVRAQASRTLARIHPRVLRTMLDSQQQDSFYRSLEEYVQGVLETNERGGAHMELATLYEDMGKKEKAEESYLTAIRIEPGLTGPRTNCAALLDRWNEDDTNELQSLARQRLLNEQQFALRAAELRTAATLRVGKAAKLRREELGLMQRDVSLLPDNAGLQYRYGMMLHLHDQPEKARQALQKASELEPDNDQFHFALAMLYEDQEEYDLALESIKRALQLRPERQDYEQVRESILGKLGAAKEQLEQSDK